MAKSRIKANITGLRLLQKRLQQMAKGENKQVFHRALTEVWRDAGEAFVRAAMRQILVQTGMSAASFLPLARALSRPEAGAAIRERLAQRTDSRRGVPELPTGRRTAGTQGPVAGRARGEKAFVFSVGTTRNFLFKFSFTTSVYQHAFHEGRQETLLAGIEAFRAVVSARLEPTIRSMVIDWVSGRPLKARLRAATGNLIPIDTETIE